MRLDTTDVQCLVYLNNNKINEALTSIFSKVNKKLNVFEQTKNCNVTVLVMIILYSQSTCDTEGT